MHVSVGAFIRASTLQYLDFVGPVSGECGHCGALWSTRASTEDSATLCLSNNCPDTGCDQIVQHREFAPWTIPAQPCAWTIPAQRASRREKHAAAGKKRPRRARSARLGRLVPAAARFVRRAARCVGIVHAPGFAGIVHSANSRCWIISSQPNSRHVFDNQIQ